MTGETDAKTKKRVGLCEKIIATETSPALNIELYPEEIKSVKIVEDILLNEDMGNPTFKEASAILRDAARRADMLQTHEVHYGLRWVSDENSKNLTRR